jgi:hypothetical protein
MSKHAPETAGEQHIQAGTPFEYGKQFGSLTRRQQEIANTKQTVLLETTEVRVIAGHM